MCTVTIVPILADASGFRMACSRDEQHGRTPAHPPQQQTLAGIQSLLPIDPPSGGTWVGVNQAGLALALLNVNLPDPPAGRDRSRGAVIPALLGAQSIDEVVGLAYAVERERMMPFRLVACDGMALWQWHSTEPVDAAVVQAWDRAPVMWTSSGLGDHLVQAPRRELFTGWFGDDTANYLDRQRALHEHHWPDREHLSICMSRDDARTVSYTTVDVTGSGIAMTYHPDRPDRDAQDIIARLGRRQVPR